MLSELSHNNRFITMMQGANRANVSFYPVDPDRLFSGTHTLMIQQALEMMVSITDGLRISETALFESGLRRIVDDLSNYYLLGYYSTADADGKFHQITVRVKRPGVEVRARAGYLAAKAAEAARPPTSVSSPVSSDTKMMTRPPPLASFLRQLPLRALASAAWTRDRTVVVRAVAELSRSTANGDDWGKGGTAPGDLDEQRLASRSRREARRWRPGRSRRKSSLRRLSPLEPDDYKVPDPRERRGGSWLDRVGHLHAQRGSARHGDALLQVVARST